MSGHIHPDSPAIDSYNRIERLAFKLWQERGSPIGTPEVDWFRAEEELRREGGDFDGSLKAVAKEVGSAVGTVTAAVEKTLSEVSEMKEAVRGKRAPAEVSKR